MAYEPSIPVRMKEASGTRLRLQAAVPVRQRGTLSSHAACRRRLCFRSESVDGAATTVRRVAGPHMLLRGIVRESAAILRVRRGPAASTERPERRLCHAACAHHTSCDQPSDTPASVEAPPAQLPISNGGHASARGYDGLAAGLPRAASKSESSQRPVREAGLRNERAASRAAVSLRQTPTDTLRAGAPWPPPVPRRGAG